MKEGNCVLRRKEELCGEKKKICSGKGVEKWRRRKNREKLRKREKTNDVRTENNGGRREGKKEYREKNMGEWRKNFEKENEKRENSTLKENE